MQESNVIIMDGLYNSGVIFKDKLDNLRLSEKQLQRLTTQYPDYEQMDLAWYHLFLLYSRMGDHTTAANCRRAAIKKWRATCESRPNVSPWARTARSSSSSTV